MSNKGGYFTRSKISGQQGDGNGTPTSANVTGPGSRPPTPSLHGSRRSRMTSQDGDGSYSSQILEKEVDMELNTELKKLTQDEASLNEEMEIIDICIGSLEEQIQEITESRVSMTEEEDEIAKGQLRTLKQDLSLKRTEKKLQKAKETRIMFSIAEERKCLQQQAALTKMKIAEDFEQLLDSDEDINPDTNVHNEPPNTKSVPFVIPEEITDSSISVLEGIQPSNQELVVATLAKEKAEKERTELIQTLLQQKKREEDELVTATLKAESHKRDTARQQIEADKIVSLALKQQAETDRKLKELMKAEETSVTGKIDTPEVTAPDVSASGLITMFAQAINQCKSDSQPRYGDRSDKFLARQVHGRELPIFNGRPEDWIMFITTYNETTKICEFSAQENLVRLRKCLRGTALETVHSLLISHENVPEILSVLKTHFGQPEYIVESLILKVKNLQPVRDDKYQTGIEFGTAVRNLVKTVESLGCQDHLSNPQLLRHLESKLSGPTCMLWIQYVSGDSLRKRNLTFFSEWLAERTAMMCQLHFPRVQRDEAQKGQKDREQPPRNRGNQQKVFALKDVSNIIFNRECSCCGSPDHPIWKCSEFENKRVETRDKLVKDKRLCISCLGTGHMMKDCRFVERKCGEGGCSKSHHRLLHRTQKDGTSPKNRECQDRPGTPPAREEQINSLTVVEPEVIRLNENGSNTLMGIVEVFIKGNSGKTVKEYAYVDPGSSIDLMEEGLRIELGIEGVSSPLWAKGINQTKKHEESRLVTCEVKGTFETAKLFPLRNVRTVNDIGLSQVTQNIPELSKQWAHLEGLPIKSFTNVKPRILIGSGSIYLTAPLKCVGGPVGPLAMKSRIGWYLGGLQYKIRSQNTSHVFMISAQEEKDEELHQLVKKSFALDDFGVKLIPCNNPQSKEDGRALKILEFTTKRIGNGYRFETGLLWKSPGITLPESKNMAMHRLHCQERKMDRSAEFAEPYYAKMEEYLQKGFIRKLNPEEARLKTNRDWYLPHFGVLNPNKPGKLRLVFDAAATSNGVSLNSALMQGPDLNNPLVGVLMKFRQYEVAFAGDIRDMFHRVVIRDEDLPSQRFLWRGRDRSREPDIYQMNVMVFGMTSSPSSAQFAKNKNADEHKVEYPGAAEAIQKKLYVDDYLDSTPTTDQAKLMIKEVILVNTKASFEVVNWTSNNREVMESIPEDIRAKEWKDMNISEEVMEAGRILGLWWDPVADKFTFKLNFHKVPKEVLDGSRRPTKREVLKLVMSIYDPLGFVSHLVVKAKILLQDVWRAGLGWDDDITEVMNERWQEWLTELRGITEVQIPRCYSPRIPGSTDVQLHIFCDASEKAYCAIAFLRVCDEEEIDVNIVCAKTRVTPLKPASIPRLELQAALMGARLASSIRSELEIQIDKTVYWSDSITVLRWLRNDARRFKQFVSHRVGEIMESSDVSEWRWVPTALNIADDGTRDNLESDITANSRWFCGAEFLYQNEETWPKEREIFTSEEIHDDPEEKVEIRLIQDIEIIAPDINRFSRYWRLIRATAYMKRFQKNIIAKNKRTLSGELDLEEIHLAEMYWWKIVQQQCFQEEIGLFHGGKPLKKSNKLFKLSAYLDGNGIIRMKGRMNGNPDVPECIRSPIIMDSRHRFVLLMVEYFHVKYGHQGKNTIANELRQQFWIIGLNKLVKSVARKCVPCQKRSAKPIKTEMGNLPAVRLKSHLRPFTNTGLDYFGPMMTKEGRRNVKCWGALFTCLSTRAVHLELAGSLSTDSAIMAIQRMSCRRGAPANIYSDNGTNFHGANNELKKALAELNQTDLEQKLLQNRIQWHFNPPAAPHMGGVWERMVGSVKKTLDGITAEREVSKEVLETLLVEVEFIVNSRPLTEVSVDPNDPEAITPNHFFNWLERRNLQRN